MKGKKIYNVVSQWSNGHKFEGDVAVTSYASKEDARAALISLEKEAMVCFNNAYPAEDINVEGNSNTNDVVIIDANEYEDWWQGDIREQVIQ